MASSPYRIAVMPGDGIGHEVIPASLRVLDTLLPLHNIAFEYQHYDYGADAYRKNGQIIDAKAMDAIRSSSDAILAGAFGLPNVRMPNGKEVAPQLDMRDHYELFASLRPIEFFPGVPTRLHAKSGQPLEHLNILIVRELTEGMFAGLKDDVPASNDEMTDRMTITRRVSEKLFRLAFAQARKRKEAIGTPGRVTLLHKSNNLRSNALLQNVFREVAALPEHRGIETSEFYIDAGAMYFVTDPERYDVIVTENIFGDIISDLGAGLIGGLGAAPSADVNGPLSLLPSDSGTPVRESKDKPFGLFQPSHGTAPDIAGKGFSNPVATILSAALMLEWLGEVHRDGKCEAAAKHLRRAVSMYLKRGPLTRDLGGKAGTEEATEEIVRMVGETAEK